MKHYINEYNCNEYLDKYYSHGLFNPREACLLYSHENINVDEDNKFMKIGEIYDDFDLILGYKKGENGIWGCNNYHYDGTYAIIYDSLKQMCEGWYQRDSNYWRGMNSEIQWFEISNFFKIHIDNYEWKAEKINEFIDYCLKSQQLTGFYVKAYKISLDITKYNIFSGKSMTNMVNISYELNIDKFIVCFKNNFSDINPKVKRYDLTHIKKAISEIDKWIKNGV